MTFTKKEISWALYDVGNSAYYTTVMAGFFPVFFKQYWDAGSEATVSSFHLGLANSVAALTVALLAPILGALADTAGIKRPLLIAFSGLGILTTMALPFIPQGDYMLAMWTFGLGMVGVATSTSIYDSQICDVTTEDKFHKLSALGYSLGYLGGGVLFAVNVAMTLKPEFFGLKNAAEAVKASFFTVGIWWALFMLPLCIYVKDKRRVPSSQLVSAFISGLSQLTSTFKEIFSNKIVLTFLAAYWLYIDGVGTIMKMAVDYGMSLGFQSTDLITALLLVQFVGFPAAIVFGRIGDRLGAKFGLYIGIAVYCATTIYAYFMTTKLDFYIMALMIGLVQGGVQSLSRSLFAKLTPTDKSAEYFGIYNMLGKFAAVLGPVIMGGVGYLTGSTRVSMLSVLILFVAGGYVLSKVSLSEKSVAP